MDELQFKKECQVMHAIDRCKQRYSIDITERDLKTITRLVEGGKNSIFLNTINWPNSIWKVYYEIGYYIVAYSPETRTIVTFLPIDFFIITADVKKLRKVYIYDPTDTQIKIYNLWKNGIGIFNKEKSNFHSEFYELSALNSKFEIVIETATRKVVNAYEIR